ncbi:MAG: copper chaperone PCu(A)C [Frankiaceae bacterium]|jgi:copper(I)-binding protein|nr:copper chaperone PCu(A)C [Frankiaceae bacterium]
MTPTTIRRIVAGSGAALALLLSACGTGGSPSSSSTSPSGSGSASAGALSVQDAWVRATDGIPDPSMTAVFGHIQNTTATARTIMAASTDASDRAELHEMAMADDGTMVMRPIQGGIPIAAGGSIDLAPGGQHIMVMDLPDVLLPGKEVTVALTLDDGSVSSFVAIVKEFAGGNENYQGGSTTPASPMDSSAMSTPSP